MSQATGRLRPAPGSASLLLLVGAAGAWIAVAGLARGMGSMPGTMGLGIGAFVGVWALMMAAMMLPSAWPFASLYVRSFGREERAGRLAVFVAAYLLVWTATGLPAYGAGWVTDRLVGSHPLASTVLAVTVFAVCGVYQLTPWKSRCLARCRSPLGLILRYGGYHGRARDLRVGISHGGFCLGCCWALMLLLVAFGFMNVAAMVVLAGVVLMEKAWVWGPRAGRALGLVALVLAVMVAFEPCLAPGLHHSVHTGGMPM